jgi:antitoxin (DNA-binding transcriptional repressor) of toxin-antitoxin stability system
MIGGEGGPAVKSINLASARRPLADYAADLGDEILVLTKGDRAVAAIVPLRNVDRESLALSQHPEFLRIIARSRAELAAGRKLTLDQMKRAVSPKRTSRKRTRRSRRS